jgi:hypothetical protein
METTSAPIKSGLIAACRREDVMKIRKRSVALVIGGNRGLGLAFASHQTLPFAMGECHDTYSRTPQGWRLRSRRFIPLFNR